MGKPTLQELLAKYGSLAEIPEQELRAVGYERVPQTEKAANSSAVQVRLIGAQPPQPPAPPRRGADGRLIPNSNWAWGSGRPLKEKVRRG